MGKLLGTGVEGRVYLDINNPNIVIKKFSPILISTPPNHKDKIKKLRRVFELSKDIGDMGIGPKVFYYKICKETTTIHFSGNSILRQRTAARFPYGSKEYKTIKNLDVNEFVYQQYVPYLVMERIDGHDITPDELDNPEIMDKVYEKYLKLCESKIGFTDIHTGNIIVSDSDERIYFIDFSSAVVLKKVPDIKSIEELKYAIIENANDYYKTSPLSETSIDSQISKEYSPLYKMRG